MLGSRYVSDPEIWRKFYKNMLNGKFDPVQYGGRQTGGGIAGVHSHKSYMIPVSPHTVMEEKPVVQVTPVAAGIERAKSELRDAIKKDQPHVPIKGKKRKRSVSSNRTTKSVTPLKKPYILE